MSVKCLVKDCTSKIEEEEFIGYLCPTCYKALTKPEDLTFIERRDTWKKLKIIVDLITGKNIMIKFEQEGFQEVVIRSNWGSYDSLDGQDLKDGETVEIMWPDESITTERVIVEESSQNIGREGTIGIHQAFVNKKVSGAEASVRLVGMFARRITRPAKEHILGGT